MESGPTEQERYLKVFKPKDFLETYYAAGSGAILNDHWLTFQLKKLFETFGSGVVIGDTLIDIGTGPSIYHLLSACESFKEIIASDLSDANRKEFETWLKNEPGAFDWSHIVKMVCELEGGSGKLQEKEDKLRRTVKQVLKCDVFKANPLEPVILPPVDCVISLLCLEGACTDVDSFCEVLKKMKALLKPGGYLVMGSVLEGTFYFVGQARFANLFVTQVGVEKALRDVGFEIKEMTVKPRTDFSTLHLADYTAYYFVLAQNPLED